MATGYDMVIIKRKDTRGYFMLTLELGLDYRYAALVGAMEQR